MAGELCVCSLCFSFLSLPFKNFIKLFVSKAEAFEHGQGIHSKADWPGFQQSVRWLKMGRSKFHYNVTQVRVNHCAPGGEVMHAKNSVL